MSHSHTPSARSLGRRIRVMYVVVLVVLLAARMWTVHGVHQFFMLDAARDALVGIAGQLPGRSTEVMNAAYVRAYAPDAPSGDGIDGAIAAWAALHAKAALLVAQACAAADSPCVPFHALEGQMLGVAASARAVAEAAPAVRAAALGRLEAQQARYNAAAKSWADGLTARFAADSIAQRHTLLLWAIAQIIATVVIVAVVVEPFIRRLQRERSEGDRTSEGHSRLAAIVERATSAVIISDPKGRVEWVNQGFAHLTGYSISEVVGRRHDEVLCTDQTDLAARAALHAAIDTGSGCQVELLNRTREGREYWAHIDFQPIRSANGALGSFMAICKDVTERRQARDALQAAKEAAERANHAKSDFLATMSHEIRTPMNGVLGFANLLRDTPLDEEQREFVRTIERSGQNLLAIINDILDFSKIEAGAMTLENIPFNLSEAIEEVAGLMAGRAEEKHLELDLSIGPNVPLRVVADPGRLKQVLVNLIGNAIKFTTSGHVYVEVTADGRDGHHDLHVRVRDTGIGIEAAAQAALFQKFTQADTSTTRRYGGTGLGLAICRQLIDLMGGRIGVDSTPGVGSTFWFSIPIAASDTMPSSAAPQEICGRSAAPASLIRVLVAEDNSVNQKVAVRMLERLGCRVDVAANGAEAVQMTTRLPYGLIFMDCHMPEMDGFEATMEIRRRESKLGSAATPIVALTASVFKEDRDRCLSAGMDGVIGKPVQPTELAMVLMRFAPRDAAGVTA
ncbi:MAG TPA: ATP-binding protein [Steroidobacteraceae bacterium]|nr:ATP-binding protein [Steroidobacteraceae bacterium]